MSMTEVEWKGFVLFSFRTQPEKLCSLKSIVGKAERNGQRFGDLALTELISTFSGNMHRAAITTGLENMAAIWSQADGAE